MTDAGERRRTVVAIGAHYDDVELRSGGTLAACAAQGWNVVYAVATTSPWYCPWPGERASGRFRSNEDVIALRKEESRRAADILGIVDVNFFDFKSLYWYPEAADDLRYLDGHGTTLEEFRYLTEKVPGREFIVTASRCPAAVRFLCDFLGRKNADVVLTHVPDDAHWEHYATSAFVCSAVRRLAGAGRRMELLAWEQGGEGQLTTSFAPTHFVDITETIDLKCGALMSFVSQFPDHDPEMFADRARRRARQYGALVGMEYAEPFMRFEVPAVPQMDIRVPAGYDPRRATRGL